MVDTIDKTAAWLDAHPGEEIPRAIGQHTFTLEAGTDREVTAERAIRPFSQWMFQRPVDFYQSLEGQDRSACERLLDEIDGLAALQIDLRRRVQRESFRLVVAQTDIEAG